MENKVNIKLLIATFAAIILFFGSHILIQEYTFLTGEDVYLDTVPVDPRDILRGDYVTLRYEIEEDERVEGIIKEKGLEQGDTIYLLLEKKYEDFGSLAGVSTEKPNEGLFIKAKVGKEDWSGNRTISTNIGKYFVPQGKGYAIERITDGLQVLAVVDKFGTAKIKNLYYNGEKIDFADEDFDKNFPKDIDLFNPRIPVEGLEGELLDQSVPRSLETRDEMSDEASSER